MTEIINRKRLRTASNECNYQNQAKCFINQQIIDQNDANKMKGIHDKTIKLLFKNSNPKIKDSSSSDKNSHGYINKKEQFRENIHLLGDGEIVYLNDNSKNCMEQHSRNCNVCSRPSAMQAIDCNHCNLEICESCGISCMQCNEPLCLTCVRMFGCSDGSVDPNALCMRCKQIYG